MYSKPSQQGLYQLDFVSLDKDLNRSYSSALQELFSQARYPQLLAVYASRANTRQVGVWEFTRDTD